MREVPNQEQTLDAANPIARFAHRYRHRLALKMVCDISSPSAAVLDFGRGLGSSLNELHEKRPDLRLFGFDPESGHYSPRYHTFGEFMRALLLGRPAPRTPNVRISHKGFDFRVVRTGMGRHFQLHQTFFSPMRKLAWLFNSQMFWVGKKAAAGSENN